MDAEPLDIAGLFAEPSRLREYILTLAAARCNKPIGRPPRWAQTLVQAANQGQAAALAGFICNRVKTGRFLFRKHISPRIIRKVWDPHASFSISPGEFDDLPECEEIHTHMLVRGKLALRVLKLGKPEYRVAYKLSLPDALLHSVVGTFLTERIEQKNVLSAHCYAYRRNQGQPRAVEALRELLKTPDCWIVAFDVASFNETVQHDVLRDTVRQVLHPLLTEEEARIVDGTIEALLELSLLATGEEGRGLIVGSPLASPLTNLYLHPLDSYIAKQDIPFVRYGDDLVGFCASEAEARRILAGIKRFASRKLKQRANRDKTRVIPPQGEFDLIGFTFAGPRVAIRLDTIEKVRERIWQYTQRSKSRIQALVEKGNFSLGAIGKIEEGYGGEIAIPSVRYLQNAIRRINALLGYTTEFDRSRPFPRGAVTFHPGVGFACNVLACAPYEDVKEQFSALDRSARRRLRSIQSEVGLVDADGSDFVCLGEGTLRDMGLRTFKDVANRYKRVHAADV